VGSEFSFFFLNLAWRNPKLSRHRVVLLYPLVLEPCRGHLHMHITQIRTMRSGCYYSDADRNLTAFANGQGLRNHTRLIHAQSTARPHVCPELAQNPPCFGAAVSRRMSQAHIAAGARPTGCQSCQTGAHTQPYISALAMSSSAVASLSAAMTWWARQRAMTLIILSTLFIMRSTTHVSYTHIILNSMY
jgi:hypothetical protein